MTYDRRASKLDPKVKQALKRIQDDLRFLTVHCAEGISEVEKMDFAEPADQHRESKLHYAGRNISKMQSLLDEVTDNIEDSVDY